MPFPDSASFPFRCPAVASKGPLEAIASNVSDEPIELWPLGFWPDGSVRIAQGLIRRHAPLVEVEVISSTRPPLEAIANAEKSFSFAGHQFDWIESRRMHALSFDGMRYFDPEGFVQEFVAGTTKAISCVVEPGSIKIVHHHRKWMRLEAYLGGSAPDAVLRFRLQWDVFEGIPGCVLSVMVIHDTPGAVLPEIGSITTRFGIPSREGDVLNGVHQKNYGYEQTESRCVETAERVEVRVEGATYHPRIVNFEVLKDDNVYGPHLNPPPADVSPVFWLNDKSRRVVFEIENLAFYRPKGIELDRGIFSFGIWPEWAGPVLWRQGRRRQMRLAMGVQASGSATEFQSLSALTAALLETARIQLSASDYRSAGFFDLPWLPVFRPDRNPRLEGWFSSVSVLHTTPGFFDFGDTRDSGYTRTYYPLGRVPERSGGGGQIPGLSILSGRMPIGAGAMDSREAVQVNNEYDVLHCLACEHLRSGNALLFRQLGWFARHTIEVDFFCHSDFETLHRAQGAHSVDHTTTGAYPSHFWTQGLAQYYFLTGDDDALEVIRALADKTIWHFEHPRLGKLSSGINREMGWAVLTLVSSYEATMDDRYLAYARKLIDEVMAEALPVDLPVFSFGHTSLLLGCKAYLEALGRDEAAKPIIDWYLALVRLAVASAWRAPTQGLPQAAKPKLSYDYELLEKGQTATQQPRSGILSGYAALACLAYAWRLTGDAGFCEAGLRSIRAFIDETPGYFGPGLKFRNVVPEGKPFAMAYRTFAEFFAALDECGLLEEFEFRESLPAIAGEPV